jgi:hypothetical protein
VGVEPSHHGGRCTFDECFSMIAESNEQMLERSGPIYDGLYEYRRRARMLRGEPG